MSSLADFNRILKGAIDKAHVVQKNDPASSINLWLKIAEYALEFAKKQSEFTLRRMIEKKVQGIIERVKNINAELRLYAAPKTPQVEFVAGEFPTPPQDAAEVSGEPGELAGEDSSTIPPQGGNVQETLGQLREEHPMEDGGKSLQEWLSSMPDGFVEINPSPYSGSIQSTLGSEAGQDSTQNAGDSPPTPAQQYFQELADEAEKKERQTAAKKNPARDPFRTIASTDQIPPGKKVCFACGAIMDQTDPFCTFCGTKLE
ncbi:MAG TPA: zinc ribbon domain-containing protein [Candidatus Lokiarchaeia archaeon]|nr:zinc ribbon domain-containing protein [Candidatus Lokiarchaeia archaeon]